MIPSRPHESVACASPSPLWFYPGASAKAPKAFGGKPNGIGDAGIVQEDFLEFILSLNLLLGCKNIQIWQ